MALRATGAATASRLFNEALAKIAMNAQQSGTGDIGKTPQRKREREKGREMEKDLNTSTLAGSALMSVVNVNKEIQEQQMNIVGGEGTFISQCLTSSHCLLLLHS